MGKKLPHVWGCSAKRLRRSFSHRESVVSHQNNKRYLSDTTLLIASFNLGKIEEIKSFLSDLPFKIIGLHELYLRNEFLESGRSFLEIARKKAIFWNKKTNLMTLGEDSGLIVEALNGLPGIYSSRFSGSEGDSKKNIEKLLYLMKGIPYQKRKAKFVCALALADERIIIFETKQEVDGVILEKPRGKMGFGYDPVFFYPPLDKTFAEMNIDEKNSISHRGKALKKLVGYLRKFKNNKKV
ncbi:MAG: RdgB/HAM1 family non-canonical purine NTP pyrophosphatase [Acidobacteriota bacterium]